MTQFEKQVIKLLQSIDKRLAKLAEHSERETLSDALTFKSLEHEANHSKSELSGKSFP